VNVPAQVLRELVYCASRLQSVARILSKLERRLTEANSSDNMSALRAVEQMPQQHETESWPEEGLEQAYQLSLEVYDEGDSGQPGRPEQHGTRRS